MFFISSTENIMLRVHLINYVTVFLEFFLNLICEKHHYFVTFVWYLFANQFFKIIYFCVDQIKIYIFVVDYFLIALHAFKICAFKIWKVVARDAEKRECLPSLRLLLSRQPNFKPSYLKSVCRYQKTFNYKNVDQNFFYPKNLNS